MTPIKYSSMTLAEKEAYLTRINEMQPKRQPPPTHLDVACESCAFLAQVPILEGSVNKIRCSNCGQFTVHWQPLR